MKLEWNADKAARNPEKHGVAFDTIRLISARKANANERQHYREANA